MRSPRFVRTKTFKAIAAAGERFGARPSDMLGICDIGAAINVDLAAWCVLIERDHAAHKQAAAGAK